ncbi:hypothetical protein BpHYR1_044848 [Brachionus plicatilis]|uniref:Uncharacterized protein n=1 Tax=Brachionus plicatilis TaxID=10195 RepID=A0A3M7RB33_BRAPC|nr:hypothetical protein BpHYR1_044848 [Brachionus plicatilis]
MPAPFRYLLNRAGQKPKSSLDFDLKNFFLKFNIIELNFTEKSSVKIKRQLEVYDHDQMIKT